MMLNGGNGIFAGGRTLHKRTNIFCKSSTKSINTEQLRQQLDHLHKEAETTRVKANSARLRLIRLSEAAEKLQRQAVLSIQTGKEHDARDLLFQKKRITQAMEKSKSRIELLDELSAKLNEAITVKEAQLVGNVSSDLEIVLEDKRSPVRIVSPKEKEPMVSDGNQKSSVTAELDEAEESLTTDESQVVPSVHIGNEIVDHKKSIAVDGEGDLLGILEGLSSYSEFLGHLDRQLNKIEAELETFIRFSDLVLESGERPENLKVKQASEFLECIRKIRSRIAGVIQSEL